jgi:hypothetical protein
VSRHTRRTLTGAAAAALVALSGCSSDHGGGSGSTSESTPLTPAQVTEALLTTQDLGPGYRQVKESEESSGLGCLAFLDDLSEDKDAAAIDHAEFSSGHDLDSADVQTLVESFAGTEAVTSLFDSIRADLDGCEDVKQTIDGIDFDLAVTNDGEKSTTDTDEQINLAATGTATSQGLELPIDLRASLVRIDNHLTGVAVNAFGAVASGLVAPLTEVAADRLAAIATGEKPPAAHPADAIEPARSAATSHGAGAGMRLIETREILGVRQMSGLSVVAPSSSGVPDGAARRSESEHVTTWGTVCLGLSARS